MTFGSARFSTERIDTPFHVHHMFVFVNLFELFRCWIFVDRIQMFLVLVKLCVLPKCTSPTINPLRKGVQLRMKLRADWIRKLYEPDIIFNTREIRANATWIKFLWTSLVRRHEIYVRSEEFWVQQTFTVIRLIFSIITEDTRENSTMFFGFSISFSFPVNRF